jgi:hypothetical protein
VQVPPAQTAGAVQPLPHWPQLLLSACVFTHAPPHAENPAWQSSWLVPVPLVEPGDP